MICNASKQQIVRSSSVVQYFYRCVLENGSWEGTVIAETSDLTMNEFAFSEFIHTAIASLVSAQATSDTGTAVTVTRNEVMI